MRPSVVATVYWTKFPSTLRLGSRMWTSSSAAGWAAMPVRSGPTFPPSPEWAWHLAHCWRKTSLPRAASPPRRTIGASSSITFWRSGSGSPPPRESSRFASPAMDGIRMGRQRLLLVEGELVQPDLAPLDAFEQRRGPVAPAEQRAQGDRPDAGRQRPEAIHQDRAHARGLAPARRLDQRGGQRRGRPGGDQGDQLAGRVRVLLAELDVLPGRVDPGLVGPATRRWPAPGASRRSRPCTARAPGPPAVGQPDQVPPSPRGRAAAASGPASPPIAASSVAGRPSGHPRARPAITAPATPGSAPSSAARVETIEAEGTPRA